MKRIITAGLLLTIFSGLSASAQNNDDVYYNSSQAQQEAKASKKQAYLLTKSKELNEIRIYKKQSRNVTK